MKKISIGILFTIIALTTLVSTAIASDLIVINANGNASYIDRTKKFYLANVGNYATNAFDYLVDYDMGTWGGGYEISVGTAQNKPIGVVASFAQNFAAFKDTRSGLPGTQGAGANAVMAYIDGSADVNGFPGVAVHSYSIAGDGTCTLYYYTESHRINLNFVAPLLNTDRFTFDIFAGPSYAHFTQRYRVTTHGSQWNGTNVVECTSDTVERLTDDLFGGEIGFSGKAKITDRFHIDVTESADFFYCYSEFKGTQTIDTGVTTLGPVSRSVNGHDTQGSFVPYLKSYVAAAYDINKNITLNMFYQFDLWFNTSRIVNPTLSGDLLTSTGPARLDDGETLFAHNIGGSVIVKF